MLHWKRNNLLLGTRGAVAIQAAIRAWCDEQAGVQWLGDSGRALMMAEDDNKQEVQASASDQEHERCNQRLEISHESNALLEEASNDGIGYTSATPPDQRGTHSYQGSSGITVAETSFCIESASNVDCAVQPETVADVGIGNDTSCDEAALDDSDEEREAAGSLMADNERVGSHEIVVFSVNVPPSERPWIRFLRNPTKLFGPREADPALGRVNREWLCGASVFLSSLPIITCVVARPHKHVFFV